MSAGEDHDRALKALGIAALRPGKDGMNPKAANFANTDEAKANPYPEIPDVLTFRDGKPVKTARYWRRRWEEIKEDLDREEYGRTPKVRWEVQAKEGGTVGNVAVVTKRLVVHVDNASYPAVKVDIRMTLITPAKADKPVPVVMEFGFTVPRRPGATPPRTPAAPGWVGRIRCSPRAGATRSSIRTASKRTTAEG